MIKYFIVWLVVCVGMGIVCEVFFPPRPKTKEEVEREQLKRILGEDLYREVIRDEYYRKKYGG